MRNVVENHCESNIWKLNQGEGRVPENANSNDQVLTEAEVDETEVTGTYPGDTKPAQSALITLREGWCCVLDYRWSPGIRYIHAASKAQLKETAIHPRELCQPQRWLKFPQPVVLQKKSDMLQSGI